MEKEQQTDKKEIKKNSKKKEVFETLGAINVNEFTKKKGGQTYLAWNQAWKEVVMRYPTATYEFVKQADGQFYVVSEIGYMVETTVTIEGVTRGMMLPVLNGANKPFKTTSYTYNSRVGSRSVAACDMFEINTALMRCLTKNLAMFGLGFYIYMGDSLPTDSMELEIEDKQKKKNPLNFTFNK
jgi:hypothetical protein